MKTGQKVEIAKACSCQKDLTMMQSVAGFKPKRKLQEGELVVVIRTIDPRGQMWVVKTKENNFYTILKDDIKCYE